MMQPAFVHLRMHTEFAIADGSVRIVDVVTASVADRMPRIGKQQPSKVIARRREGLDWTFDHRSNFIKTRLLKSLAGSRPPQSQGIHG